MITLENLKEMEPGIFDKGMYQDNEGAMFRWVAVRGGTHDWAIYELDDSSFKYVPWTRKYNHVHQVGNKVYDTMLIRRLVPCTPHAFDCYRR